jgi:hypothetical protein
MICPACNKPIGRFHNTPNGFHRDCSIHWEKGYKCAIQFCSEENRIAKLPSPTELYKKRCTPTTMGYHLYQEGDTVSGLGIVEFNHCNLPYPASMKGLFYGVCQISGHNNKGEAIFCDMKSGKLLNKKELKKRLNNKKYDYLKISKK